mmetsp:Transcript_16138/g.42351  ORF Transcript_16138/g.42351 Transcript_16138/m.42351 type:complete len:235 (+) Transcript_16138:214-918(+)
MRPPDALVRSDDGSARLSARPNFCCSEEESSTTDPSPLRPVESDPSIDADSSPPLLGLSMSNVDPEPSSPVEPKPAKEPPRLGDFLKELADRREMETVSDMPVIKRLSASPSSSSSIASAAAAIIALVRSISVRAFIAFRCRAFVLAAPLLMAPNPKRFDIPGCESRFPSWAWELGSGPTTSPPSDVCDARSASGPPVASGGTGSRPCSALKLICLLASSMSSSSASSSGGERR